MQIEDILNQNIILVGYSFSFNTETKLDIMIGYKNKIYNLSFVEDDYDDSDGYRSYIEGPGITEIELYKPHVEIMRNVNIKFKTSSNNWSNSYTRPCEIYDFIDIETGVCLCEIGTASTDDYY